MIYKKISKLAKKVFNSQTYVLMVVNRFIPKEFGKIVEMQLDRDVKSISLELLSPKEEKANILINNYRMHYKGSRCFIVFDCLDVDGFLKSQLKKISNEKEIEVDPQYIKIVQKILKI